jgi:hypothetical protein
MGYIDIDTVVQAWTGSRPKPEDSEIEAKIKWASAFIDRATRQWFEARTITAYLDGNGTKLLQLPVPVISLTSLYINGDFDNVLASTEYAVYSSEGLTDERRNPHICLLNTIFRTGNQNIKLVGSFGFMDTEGANKVTPTMIKAACLRIVLREFGHSSALVTHPLGPVMMENTDGHQVMYATPRFGSLRPGNMAITGDPQIDNVLALYKGPVLVCASSNSPGDLPMSLTLTEDTP